MRFHNFFFPFSLNFKLFRTNTDELSRACASPKAKYGVSHFWLCGGQGGVVALACVSVTRP